VTRIPTQPPPHLTRLRFLSQALSPPLSPHHLPTLPHPSNSQPCLEFCSTAAANVEEIAPRPGGGAARIPSPSVARQHPVGNDRAAEDGGHVQTPPGSRRIEVRVRRRIQWSNSALPLALFLAFLSHCRRYSFSFTDLCRGCHGMA